MQRWGGRRQGAEGHCEAWTEDGGHADGWTALLTGGWTVTEHVLDAPRRRLIARRGDAPDALGPLDALDLRVAVGRARGAPIKALAAELGWTCSVVAHRLVTAQRRLQVRCEATWWHSSATARTSPA